MILRDAGRRSTARRPGPPAALLAALLMGPGQARAGAPAGLHRASLDATLAAWPAAPSPSAGPARRLACLHTAGRDRYVGARQEVVIHAPLQAVLAVLDDVPHYRDLYPDCVEARIVDGQADAPRFVVAWERRVPVFFLPNTRYRLEHEVDRSRADRRIARYRLEEAGSVEQSDGAVVVEPLGPERTRLITYDFFDARWGPLPTSMVWRESLRGLFLSVAAVQLKAERPDWSYPQVREEARRRWEAEEGLVERCLREREETLAGAAPPPAP